MKNHLKLLALGSLLAGVAHAASVTNGGFAPLAPGSTIPGTTNLAYDVTLVGVSQHWTANNTYYLNGTVYICSNSTLTIDPGTVIRGLRAQDSQDTKYPGSLVICQGSKIIANGTANQPIVFTDQWDDNIPGSGLPSALATNLDPELLSWKTSAGATITIPTTGTDANARGYKTWNPHSGNWGGVIVCGKTFIAIGPNGERPGNGHPENGPDPLNTAQVEGLTTAGPFSQFGGGDDDDSSGEISFCQTRYGGFPLTGNVEINGWTFASCGRGTTLHHIETINAQDDGIEWFGGTVNTKYMVVWAAGDDAFDTDCGYRGKRQFGFTVKGETGHYFAYTGAGSYYSDKVFEMDGGDNTTVALPGQLDANPDDLQPYALSVDYNFTAVGKGQDGVKLNADGSLTATNTYLVEAKDLAVHVRDNAGAQIYNSIFADFGGLGTIIENPNLGTPTNGIMRVTCSERYITPYNDLAFHKTTALIAAGYSTSTYNTGYFYRSQTEGFQTDIRDNVWYSFGASNGVNIASIALTNQSSLTTYTDQHGNGVIAAPLPNPFNENFRDTSKFFYSGVNYAGTNWDNQIVGTLPILSLTRTNALFTGQKHNSGGGELPVPYMLNVTKVNPLPNPAVTATLQADRTAPNDGFFTPVSYKGAFGPNNNWLAGWTGVDALGLIDRPTPNLRANPTISMTATSAVISFATVNGVQYSVEGSANGHKWTPSALVTGSGSPATIEDTATLTNKFFYQVIPQ